MNNISPLAYIHPNAKIGDSNTIGPFCVIEADVEIGDNNTLKSHVILNDGCRLGSNNEIFPGASLSTKPQDLKYRDEKTLCIIGDSNSIRENVTISRGTASKGKTVVGNGNLFMEDVHIAHDCFVGNHCIIGNSSKIAGEITIEDHAILSACVLAHQFTNIGSYVIIQGGSKLPMDIPPFITVGKEPTRYCGINLIGLRRHNFSNERIELIHEAYRILYSKGLRSEAIEQIKALGNNEDLNYIIRFVENSKRGILR